MQRILYLLAFFFVESSLAQSTGSTITIKKDSLSNTELYERVAKEIELATDPEYFKELHDMVYFDEGIPDSVKLKIDFLAVERTKTLGLEYYYARFTFLKSIAATLAGNYSKAIQLANESLQIFLELNEYVEASQCYNTIGAMIAGTKDIEEGKTYLRKAIRYNAMEKDDPYHDRVQVDHLIVYGVIFHRSNDMDSAQLLAEQALRLAVEKKFTREEVFCLKNLGRVWKEKKKYSLAKTYFRRALLVAQSTHMQTIKATVNKYLADISVDTNQLDSAFYFLNRGLEICKNHHSFLPIQLTLLSEKSKLLAETGLPDLAYDLQLEHIALKDSFFSLEKEKEIQWVEAEFQLQNKNRDIKALSQQATIQALEIKQKNIGILIGVVLAVLIAGGIYLVNRQRVLKGTQAQMELEQRFLRSQLNPHFISNALLAVQNFMLKKQPEEASVYLSKFSKLMRETLENSRQEFILLEDELQMLTNFMDIHKMRMNDSFEYEIHMENDIDPEIDTIPPMFVQPFVENAIEHGIADVEGKGQIDLYFGKEEEYISIMIKDNGDGYSQKSSTNLNHNSLSTTIIRERMNLINKTLKNEIKLLVEEIKNEEGIITGTKVELKVPFGYV